MRGEDIERGKVIEGEIYFEGVMRSGRREGIR